MADIVVDGLNRVDFVPTIASADLILTAAEYSAGTRLDKTIAPGGMEGFEASTGEVDNTAFSSRFDTKVPGVSSYSGTRIVLKKQTGTDTIFTTMTAFATSGFIVIRYGIDADTAPAAAQKNVNVYPIMTGDWDWMSPERNSMLRYWVATPITAEPAKNVTVAS